MSGNELSRWCPFSRRRHAIPAAMAGMPNVTAVAGGRTGAAGSPYLIFCGEVSDDSDGPIELCRPVALPAEPPVAAGDVQLRAEPAHDVVYIRLCEQRDERAGHAPRRRHAS